MKPVVKTKTQQKSRGWQPQQNSRKTVDPEEWWKRQPFYIRAGIMKAFCVEALMDVVRYKPYKIKDPAGEDAFREVEIDPTDVGYYLKVEYR